MSTNYAIIKFNDGEGALLCNGCDAIIATGFNHADKEHYCDACMNLDMKFTTAGQYMKGLDSDVPFSGGLNSNMRDQD